MPFNTLTAKAMGRLGGRSTVQKHGREHMRALGKLGFAALALRLGYMGGSRRSALRRLIKAGRLRDLGPDPRPAQEWLDRVLEQFDPDAPEVPY
jgi:hypothetical protein